MKKRILLIEDDGLVLQTISNALTSKHYEVVGCKRGSEAVKAFQNQKFDLIISDIRMPEQDGIRTLKIIRELEKNMQSVPIPVIVVTGYASESVPLEAIDLGVEGYILKPFDLGRFTSTVERALSKKQSTLLGEKQVTSLFREVKALISDYRRNNDSEILQSSELRKLVDQLEDRIAKLETELVLLNISFDTSMHRMRQGAA